TVSCKKEKETYNPVFKEDLVFENSWDEDIYYFSKNLKSKHSNLFHNISQTEFKNDIDSLRKYSGELEDYQIVIGLMKIISKIGDGHTGISIPDYISNKFPFWVEELEDGFFVTAVVDSHSEIFMKEITHINGTEISEVKEKLKTVIAYENEYDLKHRKSQYVMYGDILYDLGLSDSLSQVILTLKNFSDVTIRSTYEYNSVLSAYYGDDLPVCNQNFEDYYWHSLLQEEKVLYIQYNRCSEMENLSFNSFNNEIMTLLDENTNIQKIIIDLRYNFGGLSSIINPLVEGLTRRIDDIGKENVYLVIGRQTYSSGVINSYDLIDAINPIIIGEPAGNKPNHYGHPSNFELPNSKIKVLYSTRYITNTNRNINALVPDIHIGISSEDLLQKRDPVVDYVLSLVE
ncbi:MAG: hypothetical protein GY756_27185, partial [bacterium]|nr:hypothetical protein [bacterium]